MGVEIERKFLVQGDAWRPNAEGVPYQQGYLSSSAQSTVRVRIAGNKAYLTIKSKVVNLTRAEFEYAIPIADAQQMLQDLCQPQVVEKIRYKISIPPLIWEVDEFQGANHGLILAEVELTSPQQEITCPDWIGDEVSHDPRYFNSYLAQTPFSTW